MPMGPPPGHSPGTTGPGPSAVPLAPAPPQQMAMDDSNSNDGRKAKRELSQSKRAAQNRAAQVSLFYLCLWLPSTSPFSASTFENGIVELPSAAGQCRVSQRNRLRRHRPDSFAALASSHCTLPSCSSIDRLSARALV
jgi:hypothetical protein